MGSGSSDDAARVHAFGEFEVDEGLYELRRSGVEVTLRRKSFEVLVYLIRNADRVVSKDELLERVWQGTSVSETSLANCVSEIRAALGDRRDSASAVQTMYGRGYRFVAKLEPVKAQPRGAQAWEEEFVPAGIPPRQVFVGRARMLERLGRALDRTLDGSGNVALVLGEPGIGKTRLAERFAELACARRATVLWLRGDRDGPGVQSWVDLLRTRLERSEPDDASAAAGSATGAARARTFPMVRDLLIELSRRSACLVVVDDLQLADPATLMLVGFLARELRGERVFLLGTLDAIPRQSEHRITRLVAELEREAAAETLEVSRFGEADVERFVALVRGCGPEPSLVSAIHARSEGHPLILRELAELLEQEGWSSDGATAIPSGVRATIRLRLDRLPKPCRRILEVAAVGGRDLGVTLLPRVAQVDPALCLDELERALDAGLICETSPGAGSYRFAHAIVREVLYESVAVRERVEIHRRYAGELEARRGDPGEIARHLARSNDPADLEKSVEYAARAGRRAARRGAHHRAATHYAGALSALDELGAHDPRKRCDLLLAHAWALRCSHQYRRAREVLRQAIESARSLKAPDRLAGAAMVWVGLDTLGTFDPTPIRLVEEALLTVPTHETLLGVYLLLCRIATRWLLDTPQRTLAQSLEVIAMADRLGLSEIQVGARVFLHTTLRGVAQDGDRRAVRDETLRLAARQPDRSVELLARAMLLGDLAEAGDGSGLDREIEIMARLAPQPCDASLLSAIGLRALLRGELALAERTLAPVWGDTLLAPGDVPCPPGFACQMFALRREQGRLIELEPVIRASRSQMPAAAVWRALLALLLLETGRADEAARELADLFDAGIEQLPRDAFWLGTLVHASEVVGALELKSAACELYALLEPFHDRMAVMHSFACVDPVDLALARLAQARGWSRRAEAHLDAARALARQLRAAPSLARIERARRGVPAPPEPASLRGVAS